MNWYKLFEIDGTPLEVDVYLTDNPAATGYEELQPRVQQSEDLLFDSVEYPIESNFRNVWILPRHRYELPFNVTKSRFIVWNECQI